MRKLSCPDDYRVVFMPFPGDVLGAVRVDENGYATVYINEALSLDARRRALIHELRHIERGDLSNHLTIYQAEAEAAASVPIPSVMTTSRKALTEEESWRLILAGAKLLSAGFDDLPQYNEPLAMPSPLYDTDPLPDLFSREE